MEPKMVHDSSRGVILGLEDADYLLKAKAGEPPTQGGGAEFCCVSATSEHRSESPANLNGGENFG